MKTIKPIISILFFMAVISLSAQNMQPGFTYLETGEYKKAEQFFNTILENYPNNKTAAICYGRAIGLNGRANDALILFSKLLQNYPNDLEVKLNYGESLLWNNKFHKAKTYYMNLVSDYPNNFSVLLGLANTLSNLKEYDEALTLINKSLEVSPKNPNALTSKKYIYLGYAYQNQLTQNYEKAEALLTENLKLFIDDKETLLNLANLYLIWDKPESAKIIYNRLANQEEHKTIAFNGLALISHIEGKDKKALEISSKSYTSLNEFSSDDIRIKTTERYIQALIWNKKFKVAKKLIEEQINTYPNQNWILALRATLNIYKSNFKQSLEDYNLILDNDSTSFDGNLGKANVLKALGRYSEAYDAAEKTLKFYKNQKDAVNFISQLDDNFSPKLDSKASHSFDSGDNKAYSLNTSIKYPLTKKFSVLGQYNYRSTDNIVTTNSANSNNIILGGAYLIIPNITLTGNAGLTTAKTESSNYTQFLADLSLNIKTLKLQTLDIGYKRQVESFNADLLDRELVQNNFYLNYNLSFNFNLGWYTQLIHTSQNDGNNRELIFTSLYYNLLPKPNLKVGFNYQYITFKNQVPTIYFSPEKFNAYEVFFNIFKEETLTKPNQIFYNLTGAFGYQFIENNPKQTAYRLQGILGYKFSKKSFLNAYGTHSNIASATAAGFTFTEIGLRFGLQL